MSRIERENRTIKAMIAIYCRAKHETGAYSLQKADDCFCSDCMELFSYASYRIDKCPHKEEKPSCAKCEIHCYSKIMRERIKIVMRYSGPKMLFKHPILSLFHYLDSLKSGALKKSINQPQRTRRSQ